MKKFRSKLQENCQIVCRTIGLSILISFFGFLRHPWGKGFEETIKIAIRKNHSVALLRAMIHIIPVGFALWEIVLNWNTYYVGSFLLKQVYYQTAAKTHEVMIQASLTVILFSYIRHQMVLGKGIPFGALFSGLQINQISHLWSMEFWGSMSSKHLPILKKTIMFFFIGICFILAAVAGPSSAILLIPRLSYWPAGSTHIWINATFNDVWPNRINGSSVSPRCAIIETGSVSNECPSSEWDFMQTWLTLTGNPFPAEFQQYNTLGGYTLFPTAIQLTGKSSSRQYHAREIIHENATSYWTRLSTSTTQQAVIADALTSTATIWDLAVSHGQVENHHGVSYTNEQQTVHTIANDYYQPYSAVFCVPDIIQGSNDQRIMTFPIAESFDYDMKPELLSNINATIFDGPAVETPSIRRAQLLELPGSESDNRFKWIQLPSSPLTGSSVGLIVLLPKNPSDLSDEQATTDIVVCNIAAGWGASTINMSVVSASNSPTSSHANSDVSSLVTNFSTSNVNRFQSLTDMSFPFYPPIFPSLPIEIDVEWAEYLNPYVPLANTSVINFLLKQTAQNGSKSSHPEVTTRDIITGSMTNGLARSGFTSELQGKIKLIKDKKGVADLFGYANDSRDDTVPDIDSWVFEKADFFIVDPEESKNWVKLKVHSTIQGYAYNMEGPAPKTAIAFLLVYCCLALGHCFYSGISGISSTCWDSISEVTALAMNSSSTTLLRNTCAGITEIRIFRIPVRILTMEDQEGEGEHLEIVFGETENGDSEKRAIKFNRKYGTMPAAAKKASLAVADKIVKLD